MTFTHYAEPVNHFGDDEDRLAYLSGGTDASDFARVWLYVKGFVTDGVVITPDEAVELGQALVALGIELGGVA